MNIVILFRAYLLLLRNRITDVQGISLFLLLVLVRMEPEHTNKTMTIRFLHLPKDHERIEHTP